MSALSTGAILSRMNDRDTSKRLVISPLLDKDTQAKAGQAAIDLRLGFDFCLMAASSIGSINEFSPDAKSFTDLYRREYVPFGTKIAIHPHQLMLAQSLEYLRLPSDLMAYVVGRSTWGRLGLIVATAVGIHPGFSGNLTLELRNLGETPLILYPGQTICQLFFHSVHDHNNKPAETLSIGTQYAGTVDMIPHRISSSVTHDKIKKLIERFQARSTGK